MSITPANFAVFITNANTTIREAYSSAPIEYPAYTTTMTTGTDVFEDGWIGRMPKMREWLGPRIVKEPGPQTYTVAMQVFENTYGFDMFKIADDQFGVFYPILSDLALQAKRDPEFQIRDLLENANAQTGTRQLGLDGLANFSTVHPVNIYNSAAGTYSNLFTGGGMSIGGVTVGGAFSGTAFGTLAEYMMTYKAEDGERLQITPNMVMLPSGLMAEGEYVLRNISSAPQSWATFGPAVTQVGASDNIWKRFGCDPIINKNLTSNTNWYLMDTTKSVKPFRWIQREAPVFTPRVSADDPIVYGQHMYQWGVYYRAAPAWSYAWLAAKSGP